MSEQLADIWRAISRLEDRLDRLAGGKPDEASPELAALVRAATGGDWFLSGELLRASEAEAEAAAAEGREEPELSRALAEARIGTARALANWLSEHEGAFVERGGAERGGVLWRL